MGEKKILAGICIVTGIALLTVPMYYHFSGGNKTQQLIEEFTQAVEEEQDEETTDETKKQAAISKEDAALFEKGEVIAILTIEELGIRYPVVEGADAANLNVAIGHLSETAGIGATGNCVLAGHNGSRYGEYFTHLNEIAVGNEVSLMDKDGQVFLYIVEETYITDPYDNSIKDQKENKELTMFTCVQRGSKRFVVRCSVKE